MANVFQSTPITRVRRNHFKLNHDFKFTGKMGKLIPTLVQEVLPGDSFYITSENLIRFAPLISPAMHSIQCTTHYWFVPNRIIWSKWEDFISPDLSKQTPPSWPYLDFGTASTIPKGSLLDYLGLPTNVSGIGKISALIPAAYLKIYDENYRDQNLIGESFQDLSNGINNDKIVALTTLRTRAWMHDYFTSALPWQQKGPTVNLPMDFTDVPVERAGTGGQYIWNGKNVTSGSPASFTVESGTPDTFIEPNGLFANTAGMSSNTTIADLRVALRLQEWFEIAARGGSRYIEQLKVFFGTISSDKRLNRPEYLGGTRTPVIISEVLQTSSSDGTTPQGTMAGHAISGSYGTGIRYRAEEHGFIFAIMSVMPNTAYQQGINRQWTRQSWEDYAWPQFAQLSEQPVLNKELYVADDGKNEDTFGFIPRYSEYRYSPSRVAGEFRDTLSFWHLGRQFANRPTLNKEFIECNPSTRIFAVEEGDHLWCHSFHKINVKRALPKYGVPAI